MHSRPQNRAQVHVPVDSSYYFLAGKEVEQLYPLFEILYLWRRYFSQSLKWILWAQTPKNSGYSLRTRWRQLLFVRLFKWMTKSKYILCLKYLTYEEGIFPNQWSEYFEHYTHTNSIKNGLPFVNQPKSAFVCATSHGNEEVHLNPLFEILHLWMSYFSH